MQGLGGEVGKSRKENRMVFHSLNMSEGTMFENRSMLEEKESGHELLVIRTRIQY